MKCLHCQGELVRQTAPFQADRGGIHLRLEAIPAWVCRQCGEPLFEEREVAAILETLRQIEARHHALEAA